MQGGIFDVTLWEVNVLFNFRILNTYPQNTVINRERIAKGDQITSKTREGRIKRSSREEIEKTQRTWPCSLQEPWTTPKKSR